MDTTKHTQTYANDSATSSSTDTELARPCSPDVPMARNLHRALPGMPKTARPFAYNLIELLEGDVLNGPIWGDHPLQQPKVLIRRQLEPFEREMRAAPAIQ